MGKEYTRDILNSYIIPLGKNILLYEDFSHPLYSKILGTGNFLAYRSISNPFLNKPSIFLGTRTDTPAIGDAVYFTLTFPSKPSDIISLNLFFHLGAYNTIGTMEFRVTNRTIPYEQIFGIKFDFSDNSINYFGGEGEYFSLGSSTFSINNNCWHRLSLNISLSKFKYINLALDSDIYDLSDYAYYYSEDGRPIFNNFYFALTNSVAAACGVYLSEILLMNNLSLL